MRAKYFTSFILLFYLTICHAFPQDKKMTFEEFMEDAKIRGENLRFISNKGLRVSVFIDSPKELLNKIPFNKESLILDIELKLNFYKINYTREYDQIERPVLNIDVLMLSNELGTISYGVNLTVSTSIIQGTDYRSQTAPIVNFNSLTLYEKFTIGVVGSTRYNSIRDNVLSLVDNFIADYLYANR